ncbi:hypothetical protein JCM18903_1632 [Psychrobacter sp. JCM 18903]|nr:hypothetical protein JCM18903_1632 [Psychrobacter sp. JCM 18903]
MKKSAFCHKMPMLARRSSLLSLSETVIYKSSRDNSVAVFTVLFLLSSHTIHFLAKPNVF